MKKQITTSLFLCCFFLVTAQVDTILFENFQFDVLTSLDSVVTGNNDTWLNIDEDGLEPQFGGNTNARWFHGEFFTNPLDPITGQTNFVASSLSFLNGFLPGNRNWLILPQLTIEDESYMLYWRSSPSQMPRYMDGYTVLVSNGSNLLENFSDTLFTAASMESISGDGQSVDYSNFVFTPGYLHADGGNLTDYYVAGATLHNGLLEPHSVDLSQYVGQTITIAFLHNSDDDDRIAIDDILITKSGSSQTNNAAQNNLRIEAYPNPTTDQIIISFDLKTNEDVNFSLTDIKGQVYVQDLLTNVKNGLNNFKIRTEHLPNGKYFVNIQTNHSNSSTSFIKR